MAGDGSCTTIPLDTPLTLTSTLNPAHAVIERDLERIFDCEIGRGSKWPRNLTAGERNHHAFLF